MTGPTPANYDAWNEEKKAIQAAAAAPPIFREGQAWWCRLGMNIGSEVYGKGPQRTPRRRGPATAALRWPDRSCTLGTRSARMSVPPVWAAILEALGLELTAQPRTPSDKEV